jgi:hypothetical protein
MKNVLLIALLSMPALAGERLLGSIVSGAGADTTNASTTTPFAIPPGAKLTIQCSATTSICVSSGTTCTLAGTTTNPGVAVGPAPDKLPTSANTGDLTTTAGAAVSPPRTVVVANKRSVTVRIVASAASTCNVYARNGDE